MNSARILVFTFSAASLAATYADTGSNNKESKSEMEARKQEGSASGFKSLDIDGDGLVSKAEAAGNAEITQAFDRADRNRDGKLSLAEYERLGKAKAKAKAKAKTKQAAARKSQGSASAGGTKAKEK